jgi:hypothetical protein
MKSLIEVFVAREIGAMSDEDVVQWACEVAASDEQRLNDPDFVNLAGISRNELPHTRNNLKALVAKDAPGFRMDSPQGEIIVRKILHELCQLLVAGAISPHDLCRVVEPIEQYFSFPPWLENLYNACDWVEPETPLSAVPHLIEEVQKILSAHSH